MTSTAVKTKLKQPVREASFLSDLYTARWLVSPKSAAKVALLVVAAYFVWEYVVPLDANPFAPFLTLSYRLPKSEVVLKEASYRLYGPTPTLSADNVVLHQLRMFFQGIHHSLFPDESRFLRYGKGVKDLCFVAFNVVVFSFLRQILTLHTFLPLAKRWGIRGEQKQIRFAEQGYALFYWGIAGVLGMYVMSFQDSWWFRTYGKLTKNWNICGIVRAIGSAANSRVPALGHAP